MQATVFKGCDYLGRIPINVKFLVEEPLVDGSYLSWIYPSGKFRKKGCQPIQVRVIEYAIEKPDAPDEQLSYRLITSLLDIDKFPAQLLAMEYHQRPRSRKYYCRVDAELIWSVLKQHNYKSSLVTFNIHSSVICMAKRSLYRAS